MLTVGLDVHSQRSEICVLDQNGKTMLQRGVRGSPREVIKQLQELREPFRICYEASCNYGWLHDQLTPLASSVAVAHPGLLRLIYRSKKKNDRVDAAKLAKLLYLDEVPLVHVPKAQGRAWRGMIEFRVRLVNKRTRAKNTLRAILRSLAIDAPAGAGLWSKKGTAWLKELELPTPAQTLQRDLLVEEIAHFDQQIARVTRELDTLAEKHAGVILLKTIPGVGNRTAEAVAAYIDEPRRFTSIRAIGSYFGLVPSQDQSGGTNRLGHITREGPGTVRKLLVQAAWRGIRSSPSLRAFFDRIVGGDPDRRKIALIAVAHHLARVMLAMLRSGAAWEERLAPAAAEPEPEAKSESAKKPSVKSTRGRKKMKKKETGLMGGETRPLSPPKPTSLPPTSVLKKGAAKKSMARSVAA